MEKNFPNTIIYDDIINAQIKEYVDIISGGFPCQDISIANVGNKKIWKNGKIGINGERSGLWSEMFRIIRDIRPQYIIIENSPALLIRGFEKLLCNLSEIGYNAEWQCLQASQFGFNHKRKRLYCIAHARQIGCTRNSTIFREFSEILPKQAPRQNPISMSFKRFNSQSDFSNVRMDDGFSSKLDKSRIECCGDAVIPDIAHYLFECIKKHYYK